MPDDLSNEYRFEVIARTHARLCYLGEKPRFNLFGCGRDFGLTDTQIATIRTRAIKWAKRQGKPRDVDDKRYLMPTPNEERMHAAA